MKKLNILLAVFFATILVSCSDDYEKDFDKTTFDKQHAAWLNQDIKDYTLSYKYFSSSTGPMTYTIVVRNGELQTQEMSKEGFSVRFTGINDIFEDVAAAYHEHSQEIEKHEIRSVTIKIAYNTQYHYPEKISYSVGYKEAIDGGYYYDFEVTNFEILK